MKCEKKLYHEPLQTHHSHEDGACAHNHSHGVKDKKILLICIIITALAMIFQFVYSLITNSLALLSDTLHMLSHVVALALSYFAIYFSSKKASSEHTFGFYRMEIVVAFVNALTTAFFVIFIIYEAIEKLINPQPIDAKTLIVVAVIGLLVNVLTGVLLLRADMQNLNIKSSFLHMMSDLLSSVGVILGGIIVYFSSAVWVDTLLAFVIAFVIGKWSYSLIKQSVNVLLEGSPIEISVAKDVICSHKDVLDAHDIHISEITRNMVVLTAHVVIKKQDMMKFKTISSDISQMLLSKLNIGHCTFEPEWSDDNLILWVAKNT